MEAPERNRLERLLALISLGICTAIKLDLVTLDETERLLFSPGTMRLLRIAGMQDALISVIHTGTELEDIRRLVPDHFAGVLERLEHDAAVVLSSTQPSDPQLDNWLQRQLNLGE